MKQEETEHLIIGSGFGGRVSGRALARIPVEIEAGPSVDAP